MSETEGEREKRLLKELEGKNIGHYTVLLGWWIQTKMERDKTLLTLSSGGIGLLITILTTVGVNSWLELGLFVGALLGFGICIWSSLVIYQLNSQHIEKELRENDSSALQMEKYDKRSFRSFILGVACFCSIGIVAAVENFGKREVVEMGNEKETTSVPQGDYLEKSLQGLSNLKPEQPATQTQAESSQQSDSSSESQSGDSEGEQGKD